MRQIGGDFLYAFPVLPAPAGHEQPLSVVLIDVTGHGVPAALTVSGLHSELERVFNSNPQASPGEVLAALNRHAASVLARHSVFPTAICLKVDPAAGTLAWASAGHPPGFLRRSSGEIQDLDSTTLMLGVMPPDAFDPGERQTVFAPGDAAVAFTDGASEAMDQHGHMLRTAGIRRAVETAGQTGPADAVMAAVKGHRAGDPDDDTLIVAVSMPGG
jgi:serine phosphatase RsbU (regulator of sigma subunit)